MNIKQASKGDYELLNPMTGKPCGVFVCSVCNLVTHKDVVSKCCQPCDCGKPSRNRFECRCSDCADIAYRDRRAKQLEEAELVEWDGAMIFSEVVSGRHDGWYQSPSDLLDYLEHEERSELVEFAFLGQKCVNELDVYRAVEQMTEDTYEDPELSVDPADWEALLAAVTAFNSKYAVTYYEHDYTRKVRILGNDK